VKQTDVYTPLKTYQVGHSTDGEVGHKVHSTGVNLIYSILPVGKSAPVGIKDGEIEGRIALAQYIRKGNSQARRYLLSDSQIILRKGVPEMKIPLTPIPRR
jgi:hypothetical protein